MLGVSGIKTCRYVPALCNIGALLGRVAARGSVGIPRYHTRFQELLKRCNVVSTRVELGRFNAETPKPLVLYSNKPHIGELHSMYTCASSPKSPGLVSRTRTSDGKEQVTGTSDLKQSQAYTPEFGLALARIYNKNEAAIKADAEALRSGVLDPLRGEFLL